MYRSIPDTAVSEEKLLSYYKRLGLQVWHAPSKNLSVEADESGVIIY